MSGKTFVRAFGAAFLAVFLGACSESGQEDPYKLVTLKEACYGGVVSKNFKYKFANPQIVALNHNLGLIREGNELEFIGARALEERLEGRGDGPVEFSVVKKFSPYVHFRVERIVMRGDTAYPTQAGGIPLPRITTAEEYGVSSFEATDIDAIPYNRTGVLQKLVGKKISVRGKLIAERVEGRTVYFLEGKGGRLRIGDTTEGVGLVMKVLADKNYLFEGGVTMTEMEDYSSRIATKTAGTFEVNYVMYGNRLITG